MITLTAIVLFGQCGAYRASAYASSYQYPQYNYQQQYYQQPYVEKTVFVAIEQPQYYSSVIGGALRQEQRAEAAAELAEKLQKLTGVVGQLEARLTAPQVPQYAAPSPQQPIVALPTPQRPIVQAPVPTKLPPPPPPVKAPPLPLAKPAAIPSPQYPQVSAQSLVQSGYGSQADNGDVSPPPTVPQPNPPPAGPNYDLSFAATTAPPGALAILTTKCAKCHTEGAASGGFTLFKRNRELAELGPEDKLRINQQIYMGAMPKNSKPLDTNEYAAVRAWIDQDRDAIAVSFRQSRTSN